MKVLIVTMTCGEGHNHIAKAVQNGLNDNGADSKIIQLFGYSQKEVEKQNKMFLNACKYIPHLYDFIWNIGRKISTTVNANYYIKRCKDYVSGEIEAYAPNVIVCTHSDAGAVVTYLKRNGKINAGIKIYSLGFDYCVCPGWENNVAADYVTVSDDDIIADLIAKGFDRNQILPFGIIVDKRYTQYIDKGTAIEKINNLSGEGILTFDKFTVVMCSGGNCLTSNYKLLKRLLKCKTDVQIISVSGRNQKEFDKIDKLIKKRGLTNVLNLGFCTYLDVVFSAGDLSFSRAGSGMTTEQLNKHIPFILREKLILNEKITKTRFDKLGVGIAMKKVSQAPKLVDKLAKNPKTLAKMRDKAKEFCKPNSTQDLINHVLSNG